MTALPAEVTLGGAQPLRGRLRVPGDKSLSHRTLMFAAVANGASQLSHVATGEDVDATGRTLGVRRRREIGRKGDPLLQLGDIDAARLENGARA